MTGYMAGSFFRLAFLVFFASSLQSWDETMVGFFNLVFDAEMPVKDLLPSRKDGKAVASR
jgi:hypothetical protein